METPGNSTEGSYNTTSAREPHGGINSTEGSYNTTSAREPQGGVNSTEGSYNTTSAREPHGGVNSTEGSYNTTSAREPHGGVNSTEGSYNTTSAREPHGGVNSTEGSYNTTSAREPHGVINEFDRNFRRRGKMDMHKWLIDHLPTMRPLDQNPFFRVSDSPYYNVYPMRPSRKGPPLEKTPVLPSFDKLPHMEPVFDKWPSFEMDFKNIDFQLHIPTPAPPPRASGFHMVKVLGSVVGAIVALVIIAGVRRRKASRTRRGRFTGVGAVQQGRPGISTDQPSIPNYPRQPSGQGEPGRPLNDDLPPSYYECALSSIKKYASDEPPPYANYKDAEPQVYARRQNPLIENGLGAKAVTMTITSNDSGDVAPDMKTELVFDNGRIVERLSLDLDDNNVKTEIASNDNIEQQSTRHAEVKDRAMYVDETDNVKVNTQ